MTHPKDPRALVERAMAMAWNALDKTESSAGSLAFEREKEAMNALTAATEYLKQPEWEVPQLIVNGRNVFEIDPSFVWSYLKNTSHFDAELMRDSWDALVKAAKATHPQATQPAQGAAPCARQCEAQAFKIEIRSLKSQLALLQSAPSHSTKWLSCNGEEQPHYCTGNESCRCAQSTGGSA